MKVSSSIRHEMNDAYITNLGSRHLDLYILYITMPYLHFDCVFYRALSLCYKIQHRTQAIPLVVLSGQEGVEL